MIDGRMGNIWMGGYGGLTSYSRGQFKRWTEADGLPSNSIRSLYEDRDGVLWIGTYDAGLGRLENGHFTRYNLGDGLFNNGVFQILEDSRGHLWMSCNRGIYRVAKSELNAFARGESRDISSVVYGKRDGMRNAECNGGLSPAGIRTRDGKLWFPTQDGAVIIDPDQMDANLSAPVVVIESASVDREPLKLNSAIQIPPGRENLEIDYAAPSLANSNEIKYKYKLENLDRDWVEAGVRRTAYYSHLPPGNYTFKVIAANSDGEWNPEGKSLPITILPKVYQTWWFTAATFAAVVGIVSLAWLYWLWKLQREQAAQQAFSRQLIESQENERKRIASELHDSLGQRLIIIKNLALLLLQGRVGTPELAAPQRKRVEGISTEVSEALREVKEISYDLRPYRLDRLGLTATLQVMIETASASSSIRFSSEIDNVDTVFAKPSEINFYRVVQECVNNVLKHSQAAHASVCIRHSHDRVTVTVQDDGRGFAADSRNLDSPLGGFGLTGISERAQLLGGKAIIQSAPERGTTIVIEIALER
jgi:signal transduction histidine kinase